MAAQKRAPPGGLGDVHVKSPRMRGAALAVVLASAALMLYMLVLLGRPLYWRLYADVIHRYESDAAQQLIVELQKTDTEYSPQLDTLGGRKALPDTIRAGVHHGGDQQLAPASQQQQPQQPQPQQDQASSAMQQHSPAQTFPTTSPVQEQQQQQQQLPQNQTSLSPDSTGLHQQQQQRQKHHSPQQQQQQQQRPVGSAAPGATAAPISSIGTAPSAVAPPRPGPALTAQEIEAQRAKAREKQWEDEWWGQYQKAETARKARQEKETKEREAMLVKKFNHTLSRELVQSLAEDGYLVVTWANHHYTDFALTWVYHVQQVGIKGYMVGAMDEAILITLAKRKIPTFSMAAGLTTGDFGWGSKTFAKMGRKKINLIAQFLELGVNVVISDVDVLWLRNPLPFFQRFPGADILTSTDHLSSTVGAAEELERYPEAGSAFNIGIMLFRQRSAKFVEQWIEVIEADDTIWDQNAFNDLIRAGQVIQEDDPHHYFRGDNNSLTVGVLPVAFFCSGHVYFTQAMYRTLGIKPYAVHATFQFSGTPGKRHRFREAGLWLEDYTYYHHPGGFLAFDPHIPQSLLDKAGPRTNAMDLANTFGHFELINYQLKQLRAAFALATVLGRAVILPELWCGLDRYWAPHPGTLPGSRFKLPFLCPADHILDLENGLARKLDKEEFGPDIAYREHSFLNHSALPDVVRGSVVHVVSCRHGSVGCATGDNPATLEFNRLFVEERLDSDRLAMALSSVASISVLNFTSIGSAFGNFSRPADFTRFQRRMAQYGAVWCCVDAHPGHVHYDLWWDTHHTDKFGRKWGAGTWRPKTGP